MNTKLKKNDLVKVITGRDKGKTGKILNLDVVTGSVLVEGCNIKKKTIRPRNQQEKGGIIDLEKAIHISNIQIVTKNGGTSRLGYRFANGKKMRFAKVTGEII